jgi:P27 family predicted phage terminase small subunit
MGRRGPPPTPTALKELAGNPGKRRLNENEPKPRQRKPKPPKHLCPEALAEWRRLTKLLNGMRILTEADADILAMYCDTYVRWVEATKLLQAGGLVIFTDKGYPVQSPYVGIVNKCLLLMKGHLQELGLTPSARSRIVTPDAGEKDDDFFGY